MNTRIYDISKRRGAGGFTLIELLITMAILGILTAIAVPMYLGQREKAMRAEASTNILILRQKMIDYYNENMSYGADGTYNYTNSSQNLTTPTATALLPGFKPGNAVDLFYDYTVKVCTTGQGFTATATGKTGKPVEGRTLTINQDNVQTSGPPVPACS